MRLVPRLYEELFQIHEEKTDKPSFKMVKRLEETLHKEDIQMAGEKKKNIWKGYHLISHQGIQIKSTLRYHYTGTRMAKI